MEQNSAGEAFVLTDSAAAGLNPGFADYSVELMLKIDSPKDKLRQVFQKNLTNTDERSTVKKDFYFVLAI